MGLKEVNGLRMIERHYFKNKLIKSYDFKFGFCIPGSRNGWNANYKVPVIDPDLCKIINNYIYIYNFSSKYLIK